jgi:hypothetical protein
VGCSTASAVPKNIPHQLPKVETRVEQSACPSQKFKLEKDEKVLGSICTGETEFMLTDKHLFTYFANKQPMFWSEGMLVLGSYTSKMKADTILASGLASWEATEKYCYILTKNGVLNMIPREVNEPHYPIFRMPFPATNISKDKISFYSGFIFIAGPYGDSFAMNETTRENMMFSLPPLRDAAFSIRNRRLFYGIQGSEEVEIQVKRYSITKEPTVDDIRVVRKNDIGQGM